ncbi:DUF6112 family protein [Microbacterium sp. EST19A]|uniref:DUF6112 family protein n=1 Tax=Microbacterium sp. EST19A TaxID=2862681 RepID=UPI001CBBC0D6|nr:DUF6112 family protein [Microbacterium sp. EST19A]
MNVFPDFGGLGGIDDLNVAIGAALTIILIVAVLMIMICGIVWAIATSTGNPALAAKARAGVFVAVGAAVLAGGGVSWVNWLISVGEQL